MSPYEPHVEQEQSEPERPAVAMPPSHPPAAEPTPRRRRPIVLLLLAVIALMAIGGGGAWWLEARHYESTDDAFIDAHVVRIAPQVAGRVARVLVDDNQEVKAGQTLLEIDPADFKAKVDEAQANRANAAGGLARAKAEQAVMQANAEQARAEVGVAAANAENGETQLKRDRTLVARQVISLQQRDNDLASARSSAANLAAAEKKLASSEAQLAVAKSQIDAARATLESTAAQLDQARLDLSYTRITAPEAGHITKKNVAPGGYVQVGQTLMALVPLEIWVTANFKETQLDHMRIGQKVELSIDAWPDKVLHGHVESFQHGSGAAFSLLPPENATGNFVKVVQRVPVKIVFDDALDPDHPLGPGMSVVVQVKVR